ncbi:uncharacterized protein L203_106286 [Cryptococcus depauperatus CBS 7841]|uniref:Uncharacterized protein n=1 Tax=Cryptococcus depauperatus CBS 7841 TaxID=1295531 RepID=A0AAJ8JZ83_9TREE
MAAINFAPLYNNKANGFASISAQKVAETAATNRHALINLIRLIKSLESRVCKQDDARDNLANQWENVVYARALRDALRNGNEHTDKQYSFSEYAAVFTVWSYPMNSVLRANFDSVHAQTFQAMPYTLSAWPQD